MNPPRHLTICSAGLLAMLLGCSAPTQGTKPDNSEDGVADVFGVDGISDPGQDADIASDEAASPEGWVRPSGYAAIRFKVDDSANQTYEDGQMRWTGSFSWDEKTNVIVYSTSWLPDQGPYPPLYDDGPWSQGGHEPEGAKKGDHVFEAEVWFKAEEDTTIEYGVLNEYNRWIWVGPNGTVSVPKDSTDTIDAKPLVLPKFGQTDFKVTIDLNALHPDFATISPYDPKTGAGYRVYMKSSANSWTPVQLLDDGQNGDDAAGDGIYTYVQSQHLGKHDGLLYDGQHAQFVFVFAMEGIAPDDGQEYKVGPQSALDGVKAFSDFGSPGEFHEEPILLERDSRGKVFNTTVIVGGGKPWCKEDEDCFGGVPCDPDGCRVEGGLPAPEVTSVDPESGPTDGGTEVTILGHGFEDGATVNFGESQAPKVVFVSDQQLTATTPPHDPGTVDVSVVNPDGQSGSLADAFTFEEAKPPNLPDWGKLDEPLQVETLAGVASEPVFAEVYEPGITDTGDVTGLVLAQLGYGPKDADPDDWQYQDAVFSHSTGKNAVFTGSLSVEEPGAYVFTFRFSVDMGAHWLYVDSDGSDNGFSADKAGTLSVQEVQPGEPVVTQVVPNFGSTLGGDQVLVQGQNFGAGTRVYFGDAEAQVQEAGPDSIQVVVPAYPSIGKVDVRVELPDQKTATKSNAFWYVPKAGDKAPSIDGKVGDDWDESFMVASNPIETNWGEGKNELHKLFVAYDDANLYVAVTGFSEEGANAIVGYVDRDYGWHSNYSDMTVLTDNQGPGELDDAISSKLQITDEAFGAEFAFGSVGMNKGYQAGDDLYPDSVLVGWRQIIPGPQEVGPGNFAWLDSGTVVAGDQAIEAVLPLSTLFSGAMPDQTEVGIVVRLVNKHGEDTSNQALPGYFDPSSPWTAAQVAVVPLLF